VLMCGLLPGIPPGAGSMITVAIAAAAPRKRAASVLALICACWLVWLSWFRLCSWMCRGGLLTRRVIENSVPDIPDGLVHLIHGVADLAARGVIAQ